MDLHRGLTQERWNQFPLREQVLMVGTELKRAIHWMRASDVDAAARAAARARELLDATITGASPGAQRRELCRAKEILIRSTEHTLSRDDLPILTRALIGNT